MSALIEACQALQEEAHADILYIISDEEPTINELIASFPDMQLIVATTSKTIRDNLEEKELDIDTIKIAEFPQININVLSKARELLLNACIEDFIDMDAKVLSCITGKVGGVIIFEASDIGIASLRVEVEDRVEVRAFDAILNIALEIANEGREGKRIGALFAVGDSENVMKNSRQLIVNPFKGHSTEVRQIIDKENWETFKEFAQLDGAFVINKDGTALAAGRYIGINWDIYLQGGLGGRHLAGASISKTTKAVAVTVSTSGSVRVFKDGREIFKIDMS